MTQKLLQQMVKLVTVNIGTKLMALLLSLFVWYYIYLENTMSTGPIDVTLKLEVPEGIISQAEDLENKSINSVQIVLEGPKGLLQETPSNIICKHKIETKSLVDKSVDQVIEEIKETDFNLPSPIKIRTITPRKIRVWLMKEEEKYLHVNTDKEKCLAGTVAKGYRVVEVKAEPSGIVVRGPKHILENRQTIPCVPVDVSGLSASFTRTGKINEIIDKTPVFTNDLFKLIVTIDEELVETVIKTNIAILIPHDFMYQVKTKPTEIELKLKGPAESIKALKKEHFKVFIDVSNLYSDYRELKAGSSYPGVKLGFQLGKEAPRNIMVVEESLIPVTVEIAELPKEPTPPSPGQ